MTVSSHTHLSAPLTESGPGACPAEERHALMYALSGHNSELFHSDFLAYLAACHRNFFYDVMAEIFKDCNLRTGNQREPLTLKREYQNLDIALCNPAGEILYVIENKFKSRPDAKQLKRYADKFAKKSTPRLLLLSLLRPDFSDSESAEVSSRWRDVTYGDLATAMENHLSALTQGSQFDCQLIRKYIDFIVFHHNAVSRIDCAGWEELTDSDFLNPALPPRAPYLVLMREALRRIPLQPDAVNVTVSHGSPLFEMWYDAKAEPGLKYFMQFQDGIIKLGLSYRHGSDTKSKRERRQERINLWEQMKNTPEAVAFCKAAGIAPDAYAGAGFTDKDTSMLTLFTERIEDRPGIKVACERIIHLLETIIIIQLNQSINKTS